MKLALVLSLVIALVTGACGPTDGDGDGDVDGGVDGDGDIDGDADTGPDADEEVERDLSRCGDGSESCGDCHGTAESAAPPPDLEGLEDPSEVTVGLHDVHRLGGEIGPAVDCDECHQVPTDILDVGHCDSPAPAEVRFGDLASAGGTFPIWNRDEETCSMVYCHGATLDGGSSTPLSWTSGDAVQCGDCHTRVYHVSESCGDCHGSVWSGGGISNPALHGNGRVNR